MKVSEDKDGAVLILLERIFTCSLQIDLPQGDLSLHPFRRLFSLTESFVETIGEYHGNPFGCKEKPVVAVSRGQVKNRAVGPLGNDEI